MVDECSSSEGDLLVWIVFPWSDDSVLSWSVLVVIPIGNSIVSLLERSDGFGS